MPTQRHAGRAEYETLCASAAEAYRRECLRIPAWSKAWANHGEARYPVQFPASRHAHCVAGEEHRGRHQSGRTGAILPGSMEMQMQGLDPKGWRMLFDSAPPRLVQLDRRLKGHTQTIAQARATA